MGLIPDSFTSGLPDVISLAHIDVDLYRSIMDCCIHIYPHMAHCGFMVFDDYGLPTCPGARKAVDEFFRDKPEVPVLLPTGQAVVFISH
jgi:O-methyltransferase